MKDEQTSLLFTFEAAVDDQDSGVNQFELWFGPAGNRQDPGTVTVFPTLVPEPIILTDRRSEDWDITAAVLEFRMAE